MPPPLRRTPPPVAGPPSPFLARFRDAPARLGQDMDRVPAEIKQMLVRGGWSEADAEREAQRIGQRLGHSPRSWWDIATMTLPPLAASALPVGRAAGRTVSRIGGQLLTNVAGAGALRAAQEAVTPTGKGVVGAGLTGGLSGVLPGLAQGAMSAVIGPNRATTRTQNAITHLQKSLSPEVADLLTVRAPAAYHSHETVTAMAQAVGAALDRMEQRVGGAVRGATFRIPLPGAPAMTQAAGAALKAAGKTPAGLSVPFEDVRSQIKALRKKAALNYGNPEGRQTAREAREDAARLEDSLLKQMRRQGFHAVADDYAETIGTAAKDYTAIRALNAVQRMQAGPGGFNAQDFRDLAQMVESLKSPGLRDAARAVASAVFAAKGHPGLAAHYAPFSGAKFVRPGAVQESVGPLQQPGSRLLGIAAGAGTAGYLGGRVPWETSEP